MAFFDKKGQGANTNVNQGMAECDRRLAELAQKRAAMVMQIGQLFLTSNTPESVKGSPYEELVNSVASIDKEADFQEKRKLAIQGLRRCEKCGNVLVLDSAYCNKCGEKLEPLFADQNKAQNICPQCGSQHAEGAAFCTSCGNKLG